MAWLWPSAIVFACFLFRICVGPAILSQASEDKKRDWLAEGQRELERTLNNRRNTNVAKNVIIFLGDGMGVSTVTASRFYHAQTRNLPLEDAALAWETFPNVALAKTYNVDKMTPDSAGTATAFLCGVKTRMGTIGVNENVSRGNCSSVEGNEVKSILEHSITAKKWTGIVTNTKLTDATPAASYASSANRNWQAVVPSNIPDGAKCKDIASQLIDDHPEIRVIMGGGRQMFLSRNFSQHRRHEALRNDNRNLINDWLLAKHDLGLKQDEYAYIKNNAELQNVNVDRMQYILGVFARGSMAYETNRVRTQQPSLTQMTESAIRVLEKSPNGYFLLVEGGLIDHAHHHNNAYRAFNETVAMSDAVRRAMELTDESETLIVVTADHSHVMTMGGYPNIDNPILGLADGHAGLPRTTIMYTDGPGHKSHRPNHGQQRLDLHTVNTERVDYIQDSAIPLADETHGGEDVAIYARGPMSHLFHGVHEQNYIAHAMMYASCVGVNQQHCRHAHGENDDVTTSSDQLVD